MQGPDTIPTTLLTSRVSLGRFPSLSPIASLLGHCPIKSERLPGAHLPASSVAIPAKVTMYYATHLQSCAETWERMCRLCRRAWYICVQMHLPHATFSHAQSLHSTDDMCAWLKELAGLKFELSPKIGFHPHVMLHLAPHKTLNTSTSSLLTTSPVLHSSSSPTPDLLSTHPFTHCKDPRQDGTSTEFQSSTTFGPVSSQNIRTRWTHSSFDSNSLFAPCDNLDDVLQVLLNTSLPL